MIVLFEHFNQYSAKYVRMLFLKIFFSENLPHFAHCFCVGEAHGFYISHDWSYFSFISCTPKKTSRLWVSFADWTGFQLSNEKNNKWYIATGIRLKFPLKTSYKILFLVVQQHNPTCQVYCAWKCNTYSVVVLA